MNKPSYQTELILLVMAEADLKPGLALAARIARRSGFRAEILVVADTPATLKKQVEKRLESLDADTRADFSLRTHAANVDQLINELDQQKSLRVLLVPGLEQWNANRKQLCQHVHATVACFETHPGFEPEPGRLCLLDEDQGSFGQWFADHLVANPQLEQVDLEQLRPAGNGTLSEQAPAHPAPKYQAMNDIVLRSTDVQGIDQAAKRCKAAIESAVGPVVLIRGEAAWRQWFWERQLPAVVSRIIPQMDREGRRQLAEDLQTYSRLDFEFIALICASTFLAAFGLIQNSAAVIIGAMLVAPLMTPILGAGLSLAQGNRPLFLRSLKTIFIGLAAALTTSCLFGLLVRFLTPDILKHVQGAVVFTGEMWARTHPTAIDFLVGLVGGSAAAFARTRAHLADALAGAAIAAALVPPIATAGLHLAFLSARVEPPVGVDVTGSLFFGPLTLFLANMLAIMLGAAFVLWACGLRSDHGFSRRERWSTRMTFWLLLLAAAVLVWIIQH